MKERIVWVNRIYTTNQITDWIQQFKNLIGGRLQAYEKMMDRAMEDAWKEFNEKYPAATNIKIDSEHMVEGSIMISLTGVIKC